MADISQTAANVALVSGTGTSCICGETLVQGQPVYKSSVDNRMYKAKADTSAHADAKGVMLTAGSAGQPGQYAPPGATIDVGGTLTVGQGYCVSPNNAGGIAPISDLSSTHYPTYLGIATASNRLPLRINASGVAKP